MTSLRERSHVVLFILVCTGIVGCKSSETKPSSSTLATHDDTTEISDLQPQVLTQIDQSYRAGESFTVPLNPNRVIDQITIKYDGRYSLIALDENGKTKVNDEGAPFYRDGMYAIGYAISETGEKTQVAPKKFVDAFETDNWHDVTKGLQGTKLLVEFEHSNAYKNDPDVIAAKRSVKVQSVLVRYVDDPRQIYEEFSYNPNPYVSISSDAVTLKPGQTHTAVFKKTNKIYRVDVRWGDERPRINGVYIAGKASGKLSINGESQGPSRNVAAIETQVWSPINYTPSVNGETKIDVSILYEEARIHWIRVYYIP